MQHRHFPLKIVEGKEKKSALEEMLVVLFRLSWFSESGADLDAWKGTWEMGPGSNK